MPRQANREVAITEVMQSLRRIFKKIQDYSHEVFNKFGITGPQLWTLKTIYQSDCLPIGELSVRMCVHPSTISGVVDRLEKKGYVVRDRGEKDRRVVHVRLTPKGKSLARKAPNPVQGKMIYGLKRLRREDLDRIHDSIQTLVTIMEAQKVKVTFFFNEE
jgi:MarR family transcriptional regulator, organic hydroperoxide resistance regulator